MNKKSDGGQNDGPSKEQLLEWERAARRYKILLKYRRGLYLSMDFHKACCDGFRMDYVLSIINLYQNIDDIYFMDFQLWEVSQIGKRCVLSLLDINGRSILSKVIPDTSIDKSYYIIVEFGVIRLAEELVPE